MRGQTVGVTVPAMRLRQLTVLLVEDDVDNLELLALCLEGEGATVLAAGSIAAALAMSVSRRVDVLVADMDLPDGDGCALLHQLRNRKGSVRLPAIAVSGYSRNEWREQAMTAGFDRYAVKPLSMDALVDAIVALTQGGADGENATF
ncbi:MAG TPA: response regulator [Polyangiaceae bacterium]|nr:response regulator [Polyangiaceae bacterium]